MEPKTEPKRDRKKSRRVFVSAAGFSSPTHIVSFLLEAGCELSDITVRPTNDGTWHGVGQVAPYVAQGL